jgi:hypothetical protein
MKILADGSVEGKTFSGDKYKGDYPTPNYGEETYSDFYKRVQECKKKGFHLGDLDWDDWQTYLYGTPEGGGQYVQNFIIGEVPKNEWVKYEEEITEDY